MDIQTTSALPGLDLAIGIANRAVHDVPAYQQVCRTHGVTGDVVGADAFTRLPVTTKADYLRRHHINDLMWGGDITGAGSWSATSGSTGTPTFFPRDDGALDDSIEFYGRILDENFGIRDESTLVIVCFAMGTWIGGTYSYQAFLGLRERGRRISVSTTGIDVAAAVRNLTDLGPRYDKVILAGYPPLIKDVVDQAGDKIDDLDVYLLLAGEAISEAWRDHLLWQIGQSDEPTRICLMYGTAEAGVMGHETPATIAIRRAARPGSAVARDLFGDCGTRLPTVVAVDPSRRYVEVDDGYLLFTIDTSLPLVRYRINDKGDVFSADRLRSVLDEHGYAALAESVDSSDVYVVLTGRTDVATTFYSSNIYPRHLAEAFDDPSVASRVTGRFVVDGAPDETHDPVLRVDVELGQAATADPALIRRLETLCLDALLANNDEFRTLRTLHGDRTNPRISLHPYGTAPFNAMATKHNYTEGNR